MKEQETLERIEADVVAKAIFVVTAGTAARSAGMTVAWITRVSGSPVLMAVAIHHGSRTGELIEESGWYAINALATEQGAVAKRFGGESSRTADKFAGLSVACSPHGCPVIEDALGYLECRVTQVLTTGDHRLFVGEAVAGERLRNGAPLLYTAALEA